MGPTKTDSDLMFNPCEATNDNNNDAIIGGDEGEEDHDKRPIGIGNFWMHIEAREISAHSFKVLLLKLNLLFLLIFLLE